MRAFLLLFTLSLSISCFAQVFRANTNAVWVSAVVTDEKGVPVKDLTQEDFIVQDQGKPQELTVWGNGNSPVDLAIALDNSASMANMMPAVQKTAKFLINKLRPATDGRGADRAMLLFLGGKHQVIGARENKEELLSFLNSPDAAANGDTYLFGQLTNAIRILNDLKDPNNENRKKILVVLSDGKDTSAGDSDTLLTWAHSSSVTIYTLKTASKTDLEAEKRNLDFNRARDLGVWNQLANTTGGNSYFISTDSNAQMLKDLQKAFADIGDEFGKQYFMGFIPSNPRVGITSWITVLMNKPGLRLNVRARKNYLIPDPRKM